MKKLLLSALVIASGMGLFAQSALQKQSERLSKITGVKNSMRTDLIGSIQEFSGETPLPAAIKAPDVVVGVTRYDLQSNSTMAKRIAVFPDGTMGATYTFGMLDAGQAYQDRGTGYNYFDGTSWGTNATERIEAQRTGWPSYQPYGENGEIVVSHSGITDGLVFSHRDQKGTGDWQYFYLVGPAGHEDLLWPRMITSGEFNETIHVIALTAPTGNGGSVYEGLDGALLYSRSTDGGLTWDPENLIIDGLTSNEINGIGGDDYCWANPVGETIAFCTASAFGNGNVFKSTDNGETWDYFTFYNGPSPKWDNSFYIPPHGGLDGYYAVGLDDNGMAHVAAGRMIATCAGDETTTYNYYPYSNGLLYWNETMAPMDTVSVSSGILDVSGVSPQYLLAEVQGNGEDTIVGVVSYFSSLTSMPQLAFDPTNKILYAVYSSLSVGFATEDANFRHIWYRFSDDYGQTWSPYNDLTSDVFHIFSECVFPSVADNVTGQVNMVYQSDQMPGIYMRSPTSDHAAVDNNIVHLAFNISVGVNETPANIISLEQLSPNPAHGVVDVLLNIDKAVNVSISLVNMLGQEVYTLNEQMVYAGAHSLKLDVSNYESGIYFVKVKAGSSVITKKLMIN
jgi:hypothetical protein